VGLAARFVSGYERASAGHERPTMHAWAEVHGLALLRNEGLIAGMSEMRGGKEASTLDAIFGIMRARWQA